MYFPEVVIKMLIIKNFTVYPSHLIIFATNPGFPIRKTLTIPGRPHSSQTKFNNLKRYLAMSRSRTLNLKCNM